MSGNKLPEIPKEWKWVRLGEVSTEPQYGYTTKAINEGRIKLLRTTDITKGKVEWDKVPYCRDEPEDIEKYLIKDGDIVISRAGSIGISYLIENPPDNVVFASYLIRFKPFINKKYFKYFLNSQIYWNQVEEKESGIAIPNVNATKLKNMYFVLSPLPEQQKIVDILEEAFSKIDAGVEGLKKIKKLLSLYRQSVLKYAYEGKLTQKWREKNKDKLEPAEKLIEKIKKEREERYKQEFEEWKKACEIAKKEGKKKPPKPKPPKKLPPITEEELKNLPEIPKEWKWVRLGEVSTEPQYGYTTKAINEGRIKLLRTTDITKGKVEWDKVPYCRDEPEDIEKYLIKDGDIVISRAGSIGISYLIENPPDNVVFASYLIRFKPFINKKYFKYFLNSQIYWNQVEEKESGIAIPNVNATKLKNMYFVLSPLPEQQKIVEEIEYRLSIADKLEETVDKLLKLSEKLKQSYLKYAFEGKLTEEWRKQNPHLISGDNSVDKLLEKIKAEKEKFEIQRKKSKKIQRKQKMKEKPKNLSIIEVLEANGGEMDTKEVWKASKYADNIEKFYEELKELKLNDKIEDKKANRGSILRLKK